MLYLHPEIPQAITASRNIGSDKLWSNDNMYKHLSFLAGSFTNKVCFYTPLFSKIP